VQWTRETVYAYLRTNSLLKTLKFETVEETVGILGRPRGKMSGAYLARLTQEELQRVFRLVPEVPGESPTPVVEDTFLQMIKSAKKAGEFVFVEHRLSPRISWPCLSPLSLARKSPGSFKTE